MEPQRMPPDAAVHDRFSTYPRAGTAPEIALRRELHRRGLRFRVQYRVKGLARRKVDIAFTRWKLAIQVDGCFWHGCPEHCRWPKANAEWWTWKIEGNQVRDAPGDRLLADLGWHVLRLWSHIPTPEAADLVAAALEVARSNPGL